MINQVPSTLILTALQSATQVSCDAIISAGTGIAGQFPAVMYSTKPGSCCIPDQARIDGAPQVNEKEGSRRAIWDCNASSYHDMAFLSTPVCA